MLCFASACLCKSELFNLLKLFFLRFVIWITKHSNRLYAYHSWQYMHAHGIWGKIFHQNTCVTFFLLYTSVWLNKLSRENRSEMIGLRMNRCAALSFHHSFLSLVRFCLINQIWMRWFGKAAKISWQCLFLVHYNIKYSDITVSNVYVQYWQCEHNGWHTRVNSLEEYNVFFLSSCARTYVYFYHRSCITSSFYLQMK